MFLETLASMVLKFSGLGWDRNDLKLDINYYVIYLKNFY